MGLFRVLLAGVATAGLCACGGGDSSSSPSAPSPAPTPTFTPSPTPTPTPTPLPGPLPTFSGARPNFLFVILDDMRPEMGAYGRPFVQTPNMDKVAASGAVFENAFVSYAVCNPSRSTLMSALRPDTTRIYDNDHAHILDTLAPSAVTIPDLFKAAGYDTYSIGKVYHWNDDDKDGFTRRFALAPDDLPEPDLWQLSSRRWNDRTTLRDYKHNQTAIAHLATVSQSAKPFMIFLGYQRPHMPFIAPVEDWNRYNPLLMPRPANESGQVGAYPWSITTEDPFAYGDVPRPTVTRAKGDEMRLGYYASISFVDDLLGELMQALAANGLDHNTVVVLWGDHGFKTGEHGHYGKNSPADIDIRIPLVISAPGRIKPGTRVNSIVETADILPTLAEMAGITPPTGIEGTSFYPLFFYPTHNWKSAAFAQYPRNAEITGGRGPLMGYTVRTLEYRYTAWLNTSGQIVGRELYDLRNDPDESINVATSPGYGSVLGEMEKLRLEGWRPVSDRIKR